MIFPLLKQKRRKLKRRRIVRRVGKPLSAVSMIPVDGQPLALRLVTEPRAPEGPLLTPEALVVNLRGGVAGAEAYDEARTLLRLWFKKEARRLFPALVATLSKQMGVVPGRVLVTDTRGRWGSCNYQNDIRLNWRLLMVSEPLRLYVVAHELAHIAHKDHSARYWGFLEKHMPDCQNRRAALRVFEKTWAVPDLL